MIFDMIKRFMRKSDDEAEDDSQEGTSGLSSEGKTPQSNPGFALPNQGSVLPVPQRQSGIQSQQQLRQPQRRPTFKGPAHPRNSAYPGQPPVGIEGSPRQRRPQGAGAGAPMHTGPGTQPYPLAAPVTMMPPQTLQPRRQQYVDAWGRPIPVQRPRPGYPMPFHPSQNLPGLSRRPQRPRPDFRQPGGPPQGPW
ncbi:hypothetical protein [Alicyclobacillus sp. SO9]|uniref:hypothetical protein n=1 Tax=Alicyclobacillus sp. SO9 TaxID=2665646 RepID=UPI0018E831DC|nr:hypothetical protein [Alicyclobacillus sp. SO9]QQE77191.1 hypothetical protein GI364_14585 [Alicyclobacillus sp. SO9]